METKAEAPKTEAQAKATQGTPTTPEASGKPLQTSKPFLLSTKDVQRVRDYVRRFLSADFDQDFIADSIVLQAWLKDVRHISVAYIKHKCISAWRSRERERRHNEGAFRAGLTRIDTLMSINSSTFPESERKSAAARLAANHIADTSTEEQDFIDRKTLVEEAVGKLSPFERKLIWMRYYDDQTLEEMAAKIPIRRQQIQQALQVALYKMRVHLT